MPARLTEAQRRHVEEHREEYHRRCTRWIMRRYGLDRDEAHSVIDLAIVQVVARGHEGADFIRSIFKRAKMLARRDMLRRLPLSVSTYAAEVRREGTSDQPRRCELRNDDGVTPDHVEAVADLDWLAQAIGQLTARQRRALFSRKQHSPIRREAIKALRDLLAGRKPRTAEKRDEDEKRLLIILDRRDAGWSYSRIAAAVGLSKSRVAKIVLDARRGIAAELRA